MKEFMFYIRNEKDAKKLMTPEDNLQFIKKCEVYIEKLKSDHKLVAAQPLIRDGVVLKKQENDWQIRSVTAESVLQVGYYHILANDIDEAVRIAMENPEFEYVPSATIEVRPVKANEDETGFTYPTHR
jgi:hypothetical protein